MNNRLQQFLELENLTPSQLADKLGVQRSGLSHILSGRNKPGYDFISKLLNKFPTINAEWIITGKGKPYKEVVLPSPNNSNNFGSSNSSNNSNSPKNYQLKNENSNFGNKNFDAILDDEQNYNLENISDNNSSTLETEVHQRSEAYQKNYLDESTKNSENDTSALFFGELLKSSTEDNNSSIPANNTQSISNEKITPNNSPSQLNKNELNRQNSAVMQKKRTIKRVIVFYSDGSFEELFPNR